LPVVLIGHAQQQDQPYLQYILRYPNVHWIGELDHADPLLASAYGAASVTALLSQGEVFPLTVLESLAAGTPVVMSADSALHLPGSEFALKQLRWDAAAAQRKAILALVSAPPERSAVSALVAEFSWQRVAGQLARCYAELLSARRGAAHAV